MTRQSNAKRGKRSSSTTNAIRMALATSAAFLTLIGAQWFASEAVVSSTTSEPTAVAVAATPTTTTATTQSTTTTSSTVSTSSTSSNQSQTVTTARTQPVPSTHSSR